jgi:hypothetical protein
MGACGVVSALSAFSEAGLRERLSVMLKGILNMLQYASKMA